MRRLIAGILLGLLLGAATSRADWNSTSGRSGSLVSLTGTTGTITPGILLAGACGSGTVGVTGATTSMAVIPSANTYPGDGVVYFAYVSSAGTVTVKVCAIVGLTPNASTYNVRVIQ